MRNGRCFLGMRMFRRPTSIVRVILHTASSGAHLIRIPWFDKKTRTPPRQSTHTPEHNKHTAHTATNTTMPTNRKCPTTKENTSPLSLVSTGTWVHAWRSTTNPPNASSSGIFDSPTYTLLKSFLRQSPFKTGQPLSPRCFSVLSAELRDSNMVLYLSAVSLLISHCL